MIDEENGLVLLEGEMGVFWRKLAKGDHFFNNQSMLLEKQHFYDPIALCCTFAEYHTEKDEHLRWFSTEVSNIAQIKSRIKAWKCSQCKKVNQFGSGFFLACPTWSLPAGGCPTEQKKHTALCTYCSLKRMYYESILMNEYFVC